ncbi:PhoX family phosphatase [Rhodospirillaceae bacterium KN72]|uniref:PhoX family phosphatase n=1 Tax=Pacificispira spongiicola TaxID=2729598 RepID=A0A7Y0E0W0_9PROT|nr:PhoX family phosphatase [Pacificispira spongiicola]NMM45149.1 PhoX family phosphatase [Pacificispira spongiicola]
MSHSPTETFETSEDLPTNTSGNETFAALCSRRFLLKGMLAAGTALSFGGLANPLRAAGGAAFSFDEISHGVDETHHVAPGYNADILLRWGDALFPDSPAFDPMTQTAATQERQFGYNNDFIGVIPLAADRAVLCVNHEYTSPEVMFPGLNGAEMADSADLVDIEMAAHGGTVVEITRDGSGKWAVDTNGARNRRITVNTPMRLSGPAAGHDRVKTKADPDGMTVLGTFNNCAGGITPWGTYLMAEENFNGYFLGKDAAESHPEADALKRYGAPGEWYAWGKYHDRFDIAKEPNEVNRFGWVVEVDVEDPASTPVKRTAMGRFKHEGAETIVNGDGRVVVYMGDDQRFDYLYKFVTDGKYDPANRAANKDLLDHGTLSVAKFGEDGSVTWLPLTHGTGPLTAENGFKDQGDVLISTRQASDLLGATKMDRPEDVQANPKTGKVYVMLTNNSKRKPEQVDGPNPRAENTFGQIVELTPEGGDHGSDKATWDMLVVCGDPSNPDVGAKWNTATTENGWFASPDNCTVDPSGRLWVSTDQGSSWAKSGTADGLWAMETDGDLRGTGKMFFRVPIGAELCGPAFHEDGTTLFLAVQHPATDGTKNYPGFERNSTFEDPATRWPDFKDGMPPRPSVVMITRQDKGKIGV